MFPQVNGMAGALEQSLWPICPKPSTHPTARRRLASKTSSLLPL
jgi:hypothetical protein